MVLILSVFKIRFDMPDGRIASASDGDMVERRATPTSLPGDCKSVCNLSIYQSNFKQPARPLKKPESFAIPW